MVAVVARAQTPQVAISSPTNGATVSGVVQITGTSTGLTNERVSVSIDGGPFVLATSLNPWVFRWDTTTVPDRPQTIRARVRECLGCTEAFATNTVSVSNSGAGGTMAPRSITVTNITTGMQSFTCVSSVDGVSMTTVLYVPPSYHSNTPTALFCHLHGGGGLGHINPDVRAELDARGWIGIAPDGRRWGLATHGCTWNTSAAYLDNPDPNVGPGEQDILDAINWAIANFNINSNRIYLAGLPRPQGIFALDSAQGKMINGVSMSDANIPATPS